MNAKNKFLMGFLTLSNLKMKEIHLAFLVRYLPDLSSIVCKAAISRAYSTSSTGTPSPLVPVKVYENAYLEKKQVLEENNKKSGIYR